MYFVDSINLFIENSELILYMYLHSVHYISVLYIIVICNYHE